MLAVSIAWCGSDLMSSNLQTILLDLCGPIEVSLKSLKTMATWAESPSISEIPIVSFTPGDPDEMDRYWPGERDPDHETFVPAGRDSQDQTMVLEPIKTGQQPKRPFILRKSITPVPERCFSLYFAM